MAVSAHVTCLYEVCFYLYFVSSLIYRYRGRLASKNPVGIVLRRGVLGLVVVGIKSCSAKMILILFDFLVFLSI